MNDLYFGNPLSGVDRCPHCNVANPLLSQLWTSGEQRVIDSAYVRFWSFYQCSKCFKVVMAEGRAASRVNGKTSEKHLSIARLYPSHKALDASIPEVARRYLKQAMDTLFAPDASVVMSASAVDAMLKEKGYTQGSLNSRIDEAVKDHLLTDGMGKWAHRVRLEANAVRHADLEETPPTQADADGTLEFAQALGDFLYVFNARVEKGLADSKGVVKDDEASQAKAPPLPQSTQR